MTDPERIAAELLVEARVRARLSQAEVGRRAGMPRSVVNVYEHGRRQPGVDALVRILRAAGFELRAAPIIRRLDDVRAARILSEVLDLAEALPSRHRGELTYPLIWRSVS